MRNVYIAQTVCKRIVPYGLFGEITVTLGVEGTDSSQDVTIACTVADFQIGKRYVVNISEIEEAKTML